MEFAFKNIVYVRGGINNIQEITDFGDETSVSVQPSFGVGVKIKKMVFGDKIVKQYDKSAGLFTGCPSRPMFPRGFLWDEGFHLMLICQWSKFMCMDILAHWFNTIKEDGWIPREQIRGKEAEMFVPDEFIAQERVPQAYARYREQGWPFKAVGGGSFGWDPGQPTDDTDMAMCIIRAFLGQGRFNPEAKTANGIGDRNHQHHHRQVPEIDGHDHGVD